MTAFRRAIAHEPPDQTAHRELMTSSAGETARDVRHYRELGELLHDPHGMGTTIINGVTNEGDLAAFHTDAAASTDSMLALPR